MKKAGKDLCALKAEGTGWRGGRREEGRGRDVGGTETFRQYGLTLLSQLSRDPVEIVICSSLLKVLFRTRFNRTSKVGKCSTIACLRSV